MSVERRDTQQDDLSFCLPGFTICHCSLLSALFRHPICEDDGKSLQRSDSARKALSSTFQTSLLSDSSGWWLSSCPSVLFLWAGDDEHNGLDGCEEPSV